MDKKGPSGVIGTNRGDSNETVATCLKALEIASEELNTDIQKY